MGNIVKVREVKIGEGVPKICVSIIGSTVDLLKEEALMLTSLPLDVIEWRVDFYEEVENTASVMKTLQAIRSIIGNIPLIFTFRSAKEGGEKELPASEYFALNKAVCETNLADIIDVELFNEEEDIKEIVEFAHANNVAVIISNHDFGKTPSKEEIISRLRKAQELGGDIPKIALMPNSAADVITVLDATNTMKEQYADRPIITMSMAGKGAVSRMAGEVFGSALTFAAAKKASAPGQIAVGELKRILDVVHSGL
ncbi:type I 3-dehydroquinate dehydratase [Niallia sp. NCCP-28]|uniref:type I 3-dehydroquinate dehydratase n=1 Tax=Niallia sp. NCCP-28 TaxID=2934712 RepID=UPI002080B88C|nr:type I 3-dehydroquinate dehydratase [Niallia sp. NCCP-28]GKU83261.1 3-dehydroquinate dehydratase [Niallia sp. NCCP-28]